MKIETVGAQGAAPYQTGPSPSQQSARERAINALLGQTPQVNQNNVTPEEQSAVKSNVAPQTAPESTISESVDPTPQAAQETAPEGESGQSDTNSESAKKQPQDPLSKQYAIIARKEKQLRAQAEAIKAERAALEQEKAAALAKARAEIEAEYSTKYVPKEKLLNDPFSVLNETGLNYEELTNRLLNQEKIPASVQAMLDRQEAKLKALEEAREADRKAYADAQQQQYTQAVQQIRDEVKTLVKASPELELIRESGSHEDVVQLIEKTFKEDGILLTVEEAAKAIEEDLEEEAIKIARLNKVQRKLGLNQQSKAPAPQPKQQPVQKQAAATAPLKTLSNSMATTRKLSARERAIMVFKGELKE